MRRKVVVRIRLFQYNLIRFPEFIRSQPGIGQEHPLALQRIEAEHG